MKYKVLLPPPGYCIYNYCNHFWWDSRAICSLPESLWSEPKVTFNYLNKLLPHLRCCLCSFHLRPFLGSLRLSELIQGLLPSYSFRSIPPYQQWQLRTHPVFLLVHQRNSMGDCSWRSRGLEPLSHDQSALTTNARMYAPSPSLNATYQQVLIKFDQIFSSPEFPRLLGIGAMMWLQNQSSMFDPEYPCPSAPKNSLILEHDMFLWKSWQKLNAAQMKMWQAIPPI